MGGEAVMACVPTRGRGLQVVLWMGGLTLLFIGLLWVTQTVYWGVLRLEWMAGLYTLGMGSLAGLTVCARGRKSILLGLAATCFVAMPLVFLLTRPAVTAEEAASILAEGEGLQQVEPNEAYSTMEMQNGGSFWVQRGYVFQGTSEMGEVIVFCFDPMQVQWGALRH